MNGWTVDQCIQSAEELAKHVFEPRNLLRLPFAWIAPVHRLWQVITSILLDCKYPSYKLEDGLQRMFGEDRTILDYSVATKNGQFIGMTVTTTEDPVTYTLTNYNSCGERSYEIGGNFTLSPSLHVLIQARLPTVTTQSWSKCRAIVGIVSHSSGIVISIIQIQR